MNNLIWIFFWVGWLPVAIATWSRSASIATSWARPTRSISVFCSSPLTRWWSKWNWDFQDIHEVLPVEFSSFSKISTRGWIVASFGKAVISSDTKMLHKMTYFVEKTYMLPSISIPWASSLASLASSRFSKVKNPKAVVWPRLRLFTMLHFWKRELWFRIGFQYRLLCLEGYLRKFTRGRPRFK